MLRTAPYGSWKSPITVEMAAVAHTPFTGLAMDGADLYWVENLPPEAGRDVIARVTSDGRLTYVTPAGFSVRSTVHEYGGGAFTASKGSLYFVNYLDQRIYLQPPTASPQLLTPMEGFRYADLIVDHYRNRLICVREDHRGGGEPVNSIVAIDLAGGHEGNLLVGGGDFYATPRLSPDGNWLAYLTWNHPNMPWDGCELYLAPVDAAGSLGSPLRIAGGASEAVFQPEWSPDGILHFVAETTGWWNLYRWKEGRIEALCPMEAEFGRAMWLFGYSTYGFADSRRILCSFTEQGVDKLALLDTATGRFMRIDLPFTEIDFVHCEGGFGAFVGGAPDCPYSVARLDLATGKVTTLHRSHEVTVSPTHLSHPEEVSFATSGQRIAHALYYRPTNADFTAPKGDLPPLVVFSHGGPTSAASSTLNYEIQFWTSRGIAVADVDYGGSTGYGRDFRKSLNGQWGIVDVDDCCSAALYLAQQGLVDARRLAIRGRSAGGFTTFACLVFKPGIFRAGIAHFGVADLEVFVGDTHKFESHYLESLVGPYPARKDLYIERSPIHHTENLNCALLLLQGDEDKIVLPSQSERMYEAVRRKGLPTAYVLFAGEQHGFRKSESLMKARQAELYFLSKVFGFEAPDVLEPIPIANLSAL